MDFVVEGRYFPNSLQAFTFADIQADRMERPVEVHLNLSGTETHRGTWHATARPDRRRKLMKLVPSAA